MKLFKMKSLTLYLLILCILGLMPKSVSTSHPVPFLTYTGFTPSNCYRVGDLKVGDIVKMAVSWSGSSSAAGLYIWSVYRYVLVNPTTQDIVTTSAQSRILSQKVLTAGQYLVAVAGDTSVISQYTIEISINGDLFSRDSASLRSFSYIPHRKLTLTRPCTLKFVLTFNGPASRIGSIQIRHGSDSLKYTQKKQLIFTFPEAGTYYIILGLVLGTRRLLMLNSLPSIYEYTMTIYTFCDNFCISPENPTYQASCTTICGNAILEEGQMCDNGNQPGCTQCTIDANYECNGNLGSSSICNKFSVCGDGILDQGEQCDNGNKLGCSSDCHIDNGYKCNTELGLASACGLCGNGIVEAGEECDNGNQVGCSSGCKVDTGFECRKSGKTACFRKNPICGNNLIEIGQACDDGNTDSGDGCSKSCTVEQGYSCTGQFGTASFCQRDPIDSICGNGIFEIGEECDNGSNQGCVNCAIQNGYECTNQLRSSSVCLPKIVVPPCGNGILEPKSGEICDDGNTINGDGCNNFCQIEAGWVCPEYNKCLNLQDPQLKTYCGNSKIDRNYGESCDDGNDVSGDGCNSYCRVEVGWSCINGARSYCNRNRSFCGNGVVDSGEGCDDGFPVKSGDGCSKTCQVEPGWYCQGGSCWRI